jgi:TPR repeat protein
VVVLVALQGCGTTPPPSPAAQSSPVVPIERAKLAWLFPATECPADVAAASEAEVAYSVEQCAADLRACLSRCQARDARACYSAALRFQNLKVEETYSEALFLRACRLGVSSGCTNRAAGIMKLEPDRAGAADCAVRTFRAMCDRDDPWACTMFGLHLARGEGIAPDLDRALEVLKKSCRYGSDDPACSTAENLRKEIDEAKRRADGHP